MDRAYGILEFRSVDDELRIIEGIASSDAVDDHGTILLPEGARFSVPFPLLWQHDQESPVGEVISARVVGNQILVRAQIRKIDEPGAFKDLTDKAYQAVKHRLVRGFSVGFKPLKQKGNKFLEWALRELSLVTIPSNQDATIQLVRSSYSTASGANPPGVSGHSTISPLEPRRPKMTAQEQLTQHENSRAAKVAQQNALMQRAADEGRTLDEPETEEFDTLDTEIRAIDGHLTRLTSLVRSNAAAATPVNGTSTQAAAQTRAGVPVVTVKPNTEKGIEFARYAMALVSCRGNRYEAAEYAKRTWGDNAEEVSVMLRHPEMMTRAAVAAGTTTNATFAKPFVNTTPLDDFLELLRPTTLIGRIPGLRQVPFNISMPTQTAGGTYSWVGEGAGKPVTNAQYATVALGISKAAGIIVLTQELVKSSAPSAQEAVRDELVQGMQAYLDAQFIDPAVAAVANVSPASITNGVAGTAASGTTEAAARADLRALLGGFAAGNFGLGGVVLLMSESTAFTLGTLVNAVGEAAFPGITATGGNLLGVPVITSNTVGNRIVAVHAPSILYADDGGTEIDVSTEASLIMDSTPDTVLQAGASAPVMTSLWQRNLVGLRAERWINWARARTGSVRMTTGVAYV